METKTEKEKIGDPLAMLIMYSLLSGATITSAAYRRYCLDVQQKDALIGVNGFSFPINEFSLLLIIIFLLYSAIKKGDRLLRYAYLIGTMPLMLYSSIFPARLWVSFLQLFLISIVIICLMTYIIRTFEGCANKATPRRNRSQKSGLD